ncbi:MAG: NUDIX hydrolase [Gammaproteobacteria bacterium]
MRLKLVAFAFCFYTCAQTAHCCETAAGIVPYSEVGGQILILIADHKINRSRGWGAFGGCADAAETPAQAALREFHEETRCAFHPSLELPAGQPSVQVGKFTSFILKVPLLDATEIARAPRAESCSGTVHRERGPWAWVPLQDLQNLFKKGVSKNIPFSDGLLPDASRRWFWYKSARVIDQFIQRGAFDVN